MFFNYGKSHILLQLLDCFRIRVEDNSGRMNMRKIWKSYSVCPQDAVKSGPMNQYIKYTKGFIITRNPMVQKTLIDDIINAMDEADINYTDGYRTRHRILYSNDGLVFVTYDHYETFHEIV